MTFAAISGGLIISILGVVVAVVGIAVGVFFGRKQLSRRRLSLSRQVTRLVNVHSEAKDRITIYFEGEQIEQAHLIEIRIKNSGNRPIREADFERPLTLELGGGTALTVEVADVHPGELRPEVTQVANGGVDVQVAPLLLNAGDFLSLKILARDFSGDLHCDYRIVGVDKLIDADRQAARSSRRFWEPALPAMFLVTGALIVAFFGGRIVFDRTSPLEVTLDRDRPTYGSFCPGSSGGCASPLGLSEDGYIATAGNVEVGRGPNGRFDPSALTMTLGGDQDYAWFAGDLPRRYSTLVGTVGVPPSCVGRPIARVEIRVDEVTRWSRVLGLGDSSPFKVSGTGGHSVALGAAPLRGATRCELRVAWSGLEFR